MRHGATELAFGDGDYTFRLGLAEIEELEEKTDTSVFLLFAATATELPYAKLKQYREVIRLGLIGGGMSPVDAMAMTRKYVDERPLTESVAVAHAVLKASLRQVHGGADLGEGKAAKSNASTSPQSTPGQH